MIVPSESIYEKRRRLSKEFEAGHISEEVLHRQMIELDPDDCIALAGAGRAALDNGDPVKAEEYFWRAIEASPTEGVAYMSLSRLLRESNPGLAQGLGELAIRKHLRSDENFWTDEVLAGFDAGTSRKIAALSSRERTAALLRDMEEHRRREPRAVTERLRALRLLDQLQEDEDLSEDEVDEILAEGRAMVPLLIGVLRAWAQKYLEDDDEFVMENAAAILGELGSPEEIPPLVELIALDGPMGVASWAVDRIVQRNSAGAQAYLGKNMDSLGMVGMMKIADLAMHDDEFDPSGRMLNLAADRCEELEKNAREQFLCIVMLAMSTRRSGGLKMAREALRRNSGALPWEARARCEELISFLDRHETPGPPPRRHPYTVYEICRGEASWEAGDEDEDPDSMDEEPPQQPARARQLPGRNDPCWCGSGKKYKKCHLDSDAKGESRESAPAGKSGRISGEFDGLRQRIGKFLWSMPDRDLKNAQLEFANEDEPDETGGMAVSDWLAHDWIVPRSGHTVIREFLLQNGRGLTARERDLVEAWSRSYVGLYEVREITPGKGVEVTDLILGDTCFVHDISMSNSLAKWDILFARRVPGERGDEFTGTGFPVPRMQLDAVREWLEDDRERTNLEWTAYLKANWPRIRREVMAIGQRWIDSLHLTNTDREELLLCKSTYGVLDERSALAALRGCSELKETSDEGEEPSFVWLQPNRTVMAKIRIEGRTAVLEVNSKERLKRAKVLIERAAGGSLRHLRDEFTTQKALREGAKSKTKKDFTETKPFSKEEERELISEVLAQHYATWPDRPLPALNGKTPREAAKTSEGRLQLDGLLKLIENGEERKRREGEAFYDVSKLRGELGV